MISHLTLGLAIFDTVVVLGILAAIFKAGGHVQ
jgi:hypothetical protein